MNEISPSPRSRLLVCTVGGSPEPVVAALKQWRPVRVLFVHTPQTKADVEDKVIPRAAGEGFELDAGRYDLFELPDGQDMENCLERLRLLSPQVHGWTSRGSGFEVVVDFTGGTKCMSAAIGIQASRWPCVFSYVGGRERTKDGVGIVVSGAEIIRHQANPWNARGHQAVEDFVVLFDQHAFLAASRLAVETMKRIDLPDRKREMSALDQLARAMDAWDRFDHASALVLIEGLRKSANDLRGALGQDTAGRLLGNLAGLAEHIKVLQESPAPNSAVILDLLANANRRKNEGRLDDAVARLYRLIEAVAQLALRDGHGIGGTHQVPLERVPEPLRGRWTSRAHDGTLALGLQDAFALLSELGDPVGKRFVEAGLAGQKSPLVARNQSILAHGFDRVSDAVFKELWTRALTVAAVHERDLPAMPKLVRE